MIDELALHSATDPADRAVILARASEVYALLFAEQDAFLGRNQPRAARLRDMLSPLAGDPSVLAFVAAPDRLAESISDIPSAPSSDADHAAATLESSTGN